MVHARIRFFILTFSARPVRCFLWVGLGQPTQSIDSKILLGVAPTLHFFAYELFGVLIVLTNNKLQCWWPACGDYIPYVLSSVVVRCMSKEIIIMAVVLGSIRKIKMIQYC